MGHRQLTRELRGQKIGEVVVEAFDALGFQPRADPVAGADATSPAGVVEVHVGHIAEALDLPESAVVQRLDLLGVDATPARLGPARVVAQNEFLGSCGDVARAARGN